MQEYSFTMPVTWPLECSSSSTTTSSSRAPRRCSQPFCPSGRPRLLDFGAFRYSVPAARIHSSDTRTGLFVPRGGLVPGSLLGWKRSAFCAKTVTWRCSACILIPLTWPCWCLVALAEATSYLLRPFSEVSLASVSRCKPIGGTLSSQSVCLVKVTE